MAEVISASEWNEYMRLVEFATWIRGLEDNVEERRRVTLTEIIRRANETVWGPRMGGEEVS